MLMKLVSFMLFQQLLDVVISNSFVRIKTTWGQLACNNEFLKVNLVSKYNEGKMLHLMMLLMMMMMMMMMIDDDDGNDDQYYEDNY